MRRHAATCRVEDVCRTWTTPKSSLVLCGSILDQLGPPLFYFGLFMSSFVLFWAIQAVVLFWTIQVLFSSILDYSCPPLFYFGLFRSSVVLFWTSRCESDPFFSKFSWCVLAGGVVPRLPRRARAWLRTLRPRHPQPPHRGPMARVRGRVRDPCEMLLCP